MLCPNCGTNLDNNAEKCTYCGIDVRKEFTDEQNPQMYGTMGNKYVTEQENSSPLNTAVGFIVVVAFILVLIFGGIMYNNYYEKLNEKLNEKYERIPDNYGLSNTEIEDNISDYYYKTWYLASGETLTIKRDEMIYNGEGMSNKLGYKIEEIHRSSDSEVFTLVIIDGNDDIGRLEPYTKRNSASEKEYDYIKVYAGAFAEGECELLYDRPLDKIT